MANFECDSCGFERAVPDKLVGKMAKCPDCGHRVRISIEKAINPFINSQDFPTKSNLENIVSEDSLDSAVLVDTIDVSDLADGTQFESWDEEITAHDALEDLDSHDTPFGVRLKNDNWLLDIFAGIVSGLLGVFFAIAMSLLVVSQSGIEILPFIVSSSLIGMAVGCLFFSLQSRIPFAFAGSGTVLSAVMFLFLGSIYREMAGMPFEAILSTLIAAIVLSSFSIGLVLLCVGRFNAGDLVRYIPLQILGGVIGGVGVFVVIGASDWMGGIGFDLSHMLSLFTDFNVSMSAMGILYAVGPSLVFGIFLFMGLGKYKNSFFLLSLLLMACAGGYAAGLWGGHSFLGSLALPISSPTPIPISPLVWYKSGLDGIYWEAIRSNGLYIGALIILSILTAMYRITRLELIHGQEVDLSKEYSALGLTNWISGLCGGMPITISYGRSAGCYASGGRGSLTGFVASLVCGASLYYADTIILFIPRFVPEGLLLFSGFSLIYGWVFKAKTAFTRRDDLWMLWLTFFSTLIFGMLVGIGFGVALALMVTVRRNGFAGAIRNTLSGAHHRSNVDRAPSQDRALKEYGDHIYILRLQGFLFLGSMTNLLKTIQIRLSDSNLLPVEYIILDFKLVTGIASAAGIGFDKLHKMIDDYGIELIITSAPLELEEHLDASGHLGDDGALRVFWDLEYALEWCENHILDAEDLLYTKELSLAELLTPVFPEPKYIPALMKVLKRVNMRKGEAVFCQGETPDSMYFVEAGKLDVELELEGGKLLRLKKLGPGAVFGEMGIYTMTPRSATVRATEQCVLYKLTVEKLEAVEKRAPMLVTSIHRFMVSMLSERLGEANAKVKDLMM